MRRNKIKFSANVKPEFIKELREKVKNYFTNHNISKYGNYNLVLKSIFMISLLSVPYTFIISGIADSLSLILFCWIAMGIGAAGIGMAMMHDANHGTYSKNKRINTLLGNSLYLLGGFPPGWKYQHNILHHGFTNIDGEDEDINPVGLLRFSPHKPLYKIHKYQHLYAWFLYGLMTISWATIKDFRQLYRYKKEGIDLNNKGSYHELLTKLILMKLVYYILFLGVPIIILPIPWQWILFGFLSMHFTSGLILATIFQTAHVVPTSEFPLPDENDKVNNNWAIHQLHTTSDFSPKNKIFSWLIGGLNYQIEHHLFPNISHIHYRKISSFVKELAFKYELPYHVQPNFFVAVQSHARMLKFLGRK